MWVDATGVTVQNVVRRHHVPWSALTALELLAGGHGDARFARARFRRREGRAVEVGAVGMLGHRRRVAWVAEVAPLLAEHDVPVLLRPPGQLVWRGWARAQVSPSS